jgi:KTSC domain-containing protein
VPLKEQLDVKPSSRAVSADLPEGHTGVESSALRSFKYEPETREFHARATSGDTTYVYGGVTPEEAKNFELTASKGKHGRRSAPIR